jgi:tetratricopeptide (TPR) repeat protein
MSNIMPQTPSFVFGYWRPWKENSNLFDSYLNYVKDTSLVKYGADTVGQYILEASENQVIAINKLGEAIGLGMDVLSGQLREISSELTFLNKNVDILIEQNKLSNLLLQNIAELLRVPDSEKERQHSIELGIKFFVNARKDSDLYQDALEQLCKAELLMKQDYFVLHRIGCIYLYVKEYINPEKALDYFIRAAKYASVESDPKAIRLINALADKSTSPNSQSNSDIKEIKHLAAESYEKAAFAAYVLGKYDDAVHFQSKAFNLNSTPQNRFLLSKYHIRNQNISSAIENLDKAIDKLPELALAVFKDIDLMNEPQVLEIIERRNSQINKEIDELILEWGTLNSTQTIGVTKILKDLNNVTYDIKLKQFEKYKKSAADISESLSRYKILLDNLIRSLNNYNTFLNEYQLKQMRIDLTDAQQQPVEKMAKVYKNVLREIDLVRGRKDEGEALTRRTIKQDQILEKERLILKINNWTEEDNIKLRRLVNAILSFALYIFLYRKYNTPTALFCWIIYNTVFVLYSNFRLFSQTKKVMELDVELSKRASYTYQSPFKNINFITLIIWVLLCIVVIAPFFYGGTDFAYLFTHNDA